MPLRLEIKVLRNQISDIFFEFWFVRCLAAEKLSERFLSIQTVCGC
ncbi:hypothetical protein CMV_027945, partial [Castanea mollissima]